MAERQKKITFDLFYPKSRNGSHEHKQLTDYDFWKKLAEEKAQIEDVFSRKTLAWTATVRKEMASIKSYKDPNLTKSLEMELAYSNLRADQAERNSMAFTRLSRHLERVSTDSKPDEYNGRMITYKHLLRTLDKVTASCHLLQQKLEKKRAKLDEHLTRMTQLDESKQGVTPELHGNVKDIRARLETVATRCRKAQETQASVVDEAKEQSRKLKSSWIQLEVLRSEYLVQEWLRCLTDKMASLEYDDREYECNAVKMSDLVPVKEMVERMAENKLKQFIVREVDVDIDVITSPPLSPVFSIPDDLVIAGIQMDPVVRLDDSSDRESIGPDGHTERVEVEVNYHRPHNYPGVRNPVFESVSIEKIDCHDEKKVSRCSGTSMKMFLPGDEFKGQGDCIEENKQVKMVPGPVKPYIVVVTRDYRKKAARDISIRCGQKLEVCSMAAADDMLFGYKKCRLTGREKGGYFPADCVVPY